MKALKGREKEAEPVRNLKTQVATVVNSLCIFSPHVRAICLYFSLVSNVLIIACWRIFIVSASQFW